jgi:release factor glutamine methyltransferase
MIPTIASLLHSATLWIGAASETPRLDAEILLAQALGWPRARLLAERDHRPTLAQEELFADFVVRRAGQEPVAYIIGQKAFFGLDLLVDRRVLVPRPETELLVELALAWVQLQDEGRTTNDEPPPSGERRPPTAEPPPDWALPSSFVLRPSSFVVRPSSLLIADIGTGSGAIAVALAAHLPRAQVYAVDISVEALEVAASNVGRHGLAERITLLQGDLLRPLPGPVDLLVSNPPYTILAEVEPNVRAHEPLLALEGGPDGAAVYRRLLPGVAAYLRPGGAILLEIGAWQGQLVSDMLRAALPNARVSVHQDLAGRDRVVMGET